MSPRISILIITFFALTVIVNPQTVIAQSYSPLPTPSYPPSGSSNLTPIDCNRVGIDCPRVAFGSHIANFIFKLVNPLLTLVGIIFVAALVYGGAMYVMSTGDEAKAQKAKLVIIFAVIGFLVTGIAGIAVNVVINTF